METSLGATVEGGRGVTQKKRVDFLNLRELRAFSVRMEYNIRKRQNKKAIKRLRREIKRRARKGHTSAQIVLCENDPAKNYFDLTTMYFRSRGFSVSFDFYSGGPDKRSRVKIMINWRVKLWRSGS
jgi:hypothetical protein